MDPEAIDSTFGEVVTQDDYDDYGIETATFPDWCRTVKDRFRVSVGKRIVDQVRECFTARGPKDEEIRNLLDAVYMVPPERESPLGPDGANLRTTITFEQRQTLHAFFMAVLTGTRPFVQIMPIFSEDEGRDSPAAQAAYKKQMFFDAFLDQINWRKFVDHVVQDALDYGTGFYTVGWARKVTNRMNLGIMGSDTAEAFGFAPIYHTDPITKEEVPSGRYKGPKGVIKNEGDLYEGAQRALITDAPQFLPRNYFDSFIYPTKATCVDESWFTGTRLVVTRGDLRSGAYSGIYDPQMVERVLKEMVPLSPTRESHVKMGLTLETPPMEEDGDVLQHKMGKATDRAELLEVCVRCDADGDGDYEDWYMVVETSTGFPIAISRSQTLPCTKSTRTLSIFDITHTPYGMPLPKLLEGIQMESDIATALLLDGAAIELTRIILRQKSSRNKTKNAIHVGLNELEVDDTDGAYKIETLGGGTQLAIPGIELMQQSASRATAASETMIGVQSSTSQTATETKAAQTSGAKRLSVLAGRIAEELQRALEIMEYEMTRYFLIQAVTQGNGDLQDTLLMSPTIDGRQFNTGMTFMDWAQPTLFSLTGDPATVDPVLRLQAAEKVLLFTERSPFVGASLERRYNAEREFLERYGVRSPQSIIGSLKDAMRMQEESQSERKPNLPPIEKNISPDFLAVYLQDTPDIAAAVLHYLSLIQTANGTVFTDGQPSPAAGAFEEGAQEDMDRQLQQEQQDAAAQDPTQQQ